MLINMAVYFKAIGKSNVMESQQVKDAIIKATELNPGRPLPKTTGNSELAKRFLAVMPEEAYTDFIGKRDVLLGSLEIMSGARIGELADAQVAHGCLAGNMAIVTFVGGEGIETPPRVEIGDVFVEHLNETSKTELGRVICVRGTSRGPAKVQLERALREYWLAADFPMADTVLENGWSIERPDWWVVQIPVHALRFDQAMRRRLEEWLSASKVGRVAENAKALKGDIARLVEGKDPKESKQFINVVGGSLGGPALDRAAAELTAIGVRFSIEKGPLLMKTRGVKAGRWVGGKKESVVPPMPILAASTYPLLNRCLERAYTEMIAEKKVDLMKGDDREKPDWGHYTWRRLAAESCQAAFARGECSEPDVDLLMGWRLKKWEKQMRLHYSERGVRTSRAHLTEMI